MITPQPEPAWPVCPTCGKYVIYDVMSDLGGYIHKDSGQFLCDGEVLEEDAVL